MKRFEVDLARANLLEKRIIDKYSAVDLRHIHKHQEDDVDFMLPDGTFVELKVDFYPLENFFFEIESNGEYKTKGCILKTIADEVWYLFAQTEDLYKFDTATLQGIILSGIFDHYKKSGGDNAVGLVVPVRELLKHIRYRHEKLNNKQ